MDLTKASVAVGLINTTKVTYTDVQTLEVTNSVGTYSYSFNIVPDYIAVPVAGMFGIYSFDDGAVYNSINDTNFTISGLDVQVQIVFQAAGTVVVDVKVNSTVGADSTFPLILKYGLMEIIQGIHNSDIKRGAVFGHPTAYDSRGDALKIFASGSIPVDTGTVTVAHNLGYVPSILIYSYETTGLSSDERLTSNLLNSDGDVWVDETNLYVKTLPAGTFDTYYYQIFYD